MTLFDSISAIIGPPSYSLFELRYVFSISFSPDSFKLSDKDVITVKHSLATDTIVFRGHDHDSAGQLLKGVLVLCLPQPMQIELIRLRLRGTLRIAFPYAPNQTFDQSTVLIDHEWSPLAGQRGQSMTLPSGNHEYHFEYILPGNMAQSFECFLPAASATYQLQATVNRGKFAFDIHTEKHLRIVRIPEPDALETLHTMSVENIWPDKVEYAIAIPQKAATFGGCVALDLRFTPLLTGLELGEISAKLIETREITIKTSNPSGRSYRMERDVATWQFETNRDEHWHNVHQETNQEGWVLNKQLLLPGSLRQCTQDLNQNGVKVRHRVKVIVNLLNPDGHVSEVFADLPVAIYISPNFLPLANDLLLCQNQAIAIERSSFAPPGYGDHILDQLYEESGSSHSQRYSYIERETGSQESRSGRAEDIAGLTSHCTAFEPTFPNRPDSEEWRLSQLSARHSYCDLGGIAELWKVPSYSTAVRVPLPTVGSPVPDYRTALVGLRSPPDFSL